MTRIILMGGIEQLMEAIPSSFFSILSRNDRDEGIEGLMEREKRKAIEEVTSRGKVFFSSKTINESTRPLRILSDVDPMG